VVAEGCELEVDMRAPTQDLYDQAVAEVERLARDVAIPDVGVQVRSRSNFAPMERTDATMRLVDRARAIAAELGFELRDAATGGASDANSVAGMGVPTLDGLGPVGGDAHSASEWLDLDSVVPRVTLLAGLIASQD
jgi:glutamate carboxypeptidase